MSDGQAAASPSPSPSPSGSLAASQPANPRRTEILAAAASLLAERSWDGFTMRDVAARSGLSAGAVYQYFAGKRDIFASLYAERLEHQRAALERYHDADLVTLTRHLVEDFSEVYARFGRHQLAWAAEGVERTVEVQRLGAAFATLATAVEAALDDAARRDGRRLVERAGRMPYLWAVVNGVGDQLLDGRHALHGCDRDELVEFAAQALVGGLTHTP